MCFSLTILFGRSRKRLKKKRGKGWSRYSNTSCMSKSVQVSLKCEKNLWLGYKFAGLLHLGTTLWIDYYKLRSECFDNTITPVSFSLPYCHENQISFSYFSLCVPKPCISLSLFYSAWTRKTHGCRFWKYCNC